MLEDWVHAVHYTARYGGENVRLIDADALIEVFRGEEGAKALDHFALRLIKVKKIVDDAPTIDAIPVEWLMKVLAEANEFPISERETIVAIPYLVKRWQKEQEAQG